MSSRTASSRLGGGSSGPACLGQGALGAPAPCGGTPVSTAFVIATPVGDVGATQLAAVSSRARLSCDTAVRYRVGDGPA